MRIPWPWSRICSEKQRLTTRIETFRVEILGRRKRQTPGDDTNEAVDRLLDDAERALEKNCVAEGWSLFDAARRESFLSLSEDELDRIATILRSQCEVKLSSWRKDAALTLLRNDTAAQASLDPWDVYEAQRLLDEHFQKEYRRLALFGTQLPILGGLLIVSIVGLLLSVVFGLIEPVSQPILRDWEELLGVVQLGVVGGCLSAIISTARAGTRRGITDILGVWRSTLFRPLIGAGSAVAVILFLEAGLVEVSDDAVPAFAVAAGFSEQLVAQAMSRIQLDGSRPNGA
jgi:hypothetical protein